MAAQRRKRKFQVAVVYWLDAYGQETHDERDGVLQLSAGVLVSRNKRRVQIAQIADVSGDAEPWRDVLTIPAGMVREITVFDAPDSLFGRNAPKRADNPKAPVTVPEPPREELDNPVVDGQG